MILATAIITAVLWWLTRDFVSRAWDLELLWPQFKRQARDLQHARLGFVQHMVNDPAWRVTREWTFEQFNDFVERHLV